MTLLDYLTMFATGAALVGLGVALGLLVITYYQSKTTKSMDEEDWDDEAGW